MRDILKGLEMCNKHIYKMTRWNNGRGGGSKIAPGVIEDDVMGLVCDKVHGYMPLLPDKFSDVKPRDIWLPSETWKSMGRINSYFGYHGDSAIIAVTLMDSIIDMRRFGIHDLKNYRHYIEMLDARPPGTFHDYIEFCKEFEKEMDE